VGSGTLSLQFAASKSVDSCKDMSLETIARTVISLNVSYLVAGALLAPEAKTGIMKRRSKRPSICC
jgi:hypothetical protein